jgi:hypothetical protein
MFSTNLFISSKSHINNAHKNQCWRVKRKELKMLLKTTVYHIQQLLEPNVPNIGRNRRKGGTLTFSENRDELNRLKL